MKDIIPSRRPDARAHRVNDCYDCQQELTEQRVEMSDHCGKWSDKVYSTRDTAAVSPQGRASKWILASVNCTGSPLDNQ